MGRRDGSRRARHGQRDAFGLGAGSPRHGSARFPTRGVLLRSQRPARCRPNRKATGSARRRVARPIPTTRGRRARRGSHRHYSHRLIATACVTVGIKNLAGHGTKLHDGRREIRKNRSYAPSGGRCGGLHAEGGVPATKCRPGGRLSPLRILKGGAADSGKEAMK